MLIGSPPCTSFCSWQSLNAARLGWTTKDVQRRRAEGELHVSFCCELYRLQADAGRYYLHEHPASAASWQLEYSGQAALSKWSETSASTARRRPTAAR